MLNFRCFEILSILPARADEKPHPALDRVELCDLDISYLPFFFALNFAHLARWAAAILARAAAESFRLPPPLELPVTPLNAAIALSNFERSAFNCSSTAPRSVIGLTFYRQDLTAC